MNSDNLNRILRLAYVYIFFSISINTHALNLLPPIPEPAINPHLATTFAGVRTGNAAYVGDAKDQDETMLAALAYLHPSSPYKGQQAILDRLIVLLDGRFTMWSNGLNLSDHMSSVQPTYAYLALKTYQPDKIPADKKAMWEAAIDAHTKYLIANNPGIYANHSVGSLIVNMEVYRIMSVYFGALAVGDSVSAEIGRTAFEDCLTKSLLGDGATHYSSYSNESYGYHPIVVAYASWYYLFTGSSAVKSFLVGMKNYTPLSEHPGGFAEFSTAPPWKCQYVSNFNKNCALTMAYLTGDGYNYTIGKGSSELISAFIYRSNVIAKALPDNFIVYDRNTFGPRGRYGAWGVVGTTRDPSTGLPEVVETPAAGSCGSSTFVGAYTLDSPTGKLSGALHGACPAVKYASGVEADFARGSKWAFLTGVNCHNATSKSKSIYGLSAIYDVYKNISNFPASADVNWNAKQEWVYTPDRLIGMMEISTDVASNMYGLAQRLNLVSYRGTSTPGDGKAQILYRVDKDTWSYGNLRFKVHAKNYMGATDSIYHDIYGNGATDQGSCIVELHDEKSGSDLPYVYPAGTKRYAIVEAIINTKSYSSNVTKLNLIDGLNGFEFTEQAGRKIQMIHNATATAISFSETLSCPYGKVRVLQSWDDKTLISLNATAGSTAIPAINIPAYGNIVIVNSDIYDDQQAGYSTYDNILPAGIPLPAAPATIKATPLNAAVALSWSSAGGWVDSFAVYRSTISNGTYTKIAKSVSTTDFRDTTVSNGTSYYYVVKALTLAGESSNSAEVSATPLASIKTALNSIQENKLDQILSPNPANSILNLKNVAKSTITIINAQGKTVLQTYSENEEAQMDVSKLAVAYYIVKIRTGNSVTERKLLIRR